MTGTWRYRSLPPPRASFLVPLALVYIFAGLIGHDPWKSDDAIHFGVVSGFFNGGDWLVPHLAGEVWLESPPLFHWVAALVAKVACWLLPLPDAVRLTTGLFTAVLLTALSGAARALQGRDAGAAAVLIAIGCLGLLVPLHDTQPVSTLLAGSALTYWGLALLRQQPTKGGLLLGSGFGIAFLASGLDACITLLPVVLLSTLSGQWRGNARAYAIATLSALPLVILWPALLAWQAPQALSAWWANELASLHPGNGTLRDHAELLAWFAWPALPLALWSLWLHRRRANRLVIALPLAGTVLCLGIQIVLRDARPVSALPLLVPLILLATTAAGQLRRGAASAFDWFAMMTFTLVAFLVWLGSVAMVFGVPPQIQHNFAKLEPGFVAHFSLFAYIVAAALTLLWFWHLWSTPRSSWRAITHWAGGVTLMWALLAALWYPWIDYGKSYRGVALSLRQAVPAGDCVASNKLGDPQRASLEYFSGIVTRRSGPEKSGGCPLLLIQGTARDDAAPTGWQKVWEGNRPGDRSERLRLYRRNPA
jgi:4-amino-4-deoxy-L-arabinose transferase-like glycosyltransferase